jgi:hypothetical protein
MDWITIGTDNDQRMSLDSELSRADRGQRVDHTESVSPAWSDRENFERSVGTVAGVGILELTLAVDEEGFGILTSVGGQPTGEPFKCVLVHPVTKEHDVGGQIVVVKVAIGIP